MLWLIQNNYVTAMTARLAWALRLSGRPMHDFSVVPGEPLPEMPIQPHDDHFFYGSTGMLQMLRESKWSSSLFDTAEALDQRNWVHHLGEAMLNPEFELMTVKELRGKTLESDRFVRPVLDQKAFTGTIVRPGDLSSMFKNHKGWFREHPEDLLLAVSPVVADIQSEYRFVVVDGHVRAGSRYRHLGRLAVDGYVPEEVSRSAQALADQWTPAPVTVMDVAVLAGGTVRVVEFNSVHSAGIYAIPGDHFAQVIESAVLTRRRQATS